MGENFKSATFNDGLLLPAGRTPGLVETGQSAVERTLNNSETLNNNKNRKQDVYRSRASRQNTSVIQLPLHEDEAIKGVLEKDSQAALEKSCQSGAFGYEEKIKQKRGRAVKNVCQWVFPPNVKNRHKFVVSSLRQGITPDVAFQRVEGSKEVQSTSPSLSTKKSNIRVNRKRSRHERNVGTNTMIHPTVRGAEFDKRFLRYKLTPAGERMEDILVRSMSLTAVRMRHVSHPKAAIRENHIEKIFDEPSRSESSSRIGPRYQARIPSKSIIDNARSGAAVDSFVPR